MYQATRQIILTAAFLALGFFPALSIVFSVGAQTLIPPSGMPAGSPSISTFTVYGSDERTMSRGDGNCFVTKHGIESEEGNLLTYSKKLWEAPAEVKGAWQKEYNGAAGSVILVLTADGQMHRIELVTLDGETVLKKESTIPSVPTANGVSVVKGDDLYAISQNQVFALHDGITWQIDTIGLGSAHPSDIALDSSQNVYLSASTGIFQQALAESQWHLLSGSPANATYMFATLREILFAATSNGLYKSVDRGVHWTLDTAGMGALQVRGMSEDSLGDLFAITSNYYSGQQVWTRTSVGPWHAIGQGLTSLSPDPSSAYLTGIAVDRRGIHVSSAFGMFHSFDGGQIWQPLTTGFPADNAYSFYKYSNGNSIMTTGLGLYSRSLSDTGWTKRFPQTQYFSSIRLFADNVGHLYARGASRTEHFKPLAPDIFMSSDQGMTWQPDTMGQSNMPNGIEYVDEFGNAHLATYGYPHLQLFVKSPAGTWLGDSTGYTPQTGDAASAFASDRHGSVYIAITNSTNGDRLLKRPSSGGSWVEVPLDPSIKLPNSFTSTKDGKLIAGNTNTALGYYDGNVWTIIPNPPGLNNPSGYPQSVDSSGRLWVLFGSVDQNYYFTPYGAFWTSDFGAHWTQASDGSINFSTLVSFGDTTYGLNSGKGLYYFVPGNAGVEAQNVPNSNISIVPNPAKGVVSIEVNAPVVSRVEIFDRLGNLMRSLKGTPVSTWDGNDTAGIAVANGIYFIRITGRDEHGNLFQASKQVVMER
jgi:hypothetical protein